MRVRTTFAAFGLAAAALVGAAGNATATGNDDGTTVLNGIGNVSPVGEKPVGFIDIQGKSDAETLSNILDNIPTLSGNGAGTR